MDGRVVYLVGVALSVFTNYTVAEPQGTFRNTLQKVYSLMTNL